MNHQDIGSAGELQCCLDSRRSGEYAAAMSNTRRNDSQGRGAGKPDTIAGFLADALNMEDQISSGVYEDYMRPENWPEGLDEGVFREIQRRLNILIRDTRRHKETLQTLLKEHSHAE